MENPGSRSGGTEESPLPPLSGVQEQSTSESLGDSSGPRRPLPPLSPLTGGYLLIVVGEPHSERHKEIILQKIAKGFLSWDVNECHVNLEKELNALTGQALGGEEARFGERLIQYATENLVTEILIHPQLNTLHQCLKNLLSSFTKHRHVIHAGYTFAGNGSWILQDGTLSISDLIEALHEAEVLRVLKAYENSVSIDVHCASEGDWTTDRFQREPVTKLCTVRVNPADVITAGNPAISAFIDYLSPFLEPANIQQLLQPTDIVGNIRFTHPTLYVFPGGQGDAALFGINGFNMLIDGGFARKACFWDFARHLDRLDAVLLTRLNNSTVNGISAVLQRKKMNHVYPQIGHFFCNLQDRKIALSPDGDKDKDSLIVNLAEEGHEIVANLRHLALKPHPCYRDGHQIDPVNLYHKVGHGKLDMYVISPARDSQAVKEFLAKWTTNDSQLFSSTGRKVGGKAFEFPLQNLVSICALLVWQPANPNDTITRILFPGSTPQHKIFEGLEKLRHLEFLKHPVCSASSLGPSSGSETAVRSLSKTRQSRLIENKAMGRIHVRQVRSRSEKTPSREAKPKVDTNKLLDEKKDTEPPVENPFMKLDNKLLTKDEQMENIKKEIHKIELADNDDQKKKAVVHRSKYDMRHVKSKVDSRAPSKSLERKKVAEKKPEGEASPPSTPKKADGTVIKKEKAKLGPKLPAKTTSSPPTTPAKSAKEANNRKVLEARLTRSASKPTAPKKKEDTPPPSTAAPKSDRKPLARRPKASQSPVNKSKPKAEPEPPRKLQDHPELQDVLVATAAAVSVSSLVGKPLLNVYKGAEYEKTEPQEKSVEKTKPNESETEPKETDTMAVNQRIKSTLSQQGEHDHGHIQDDHQAQPPHQEEGEEEEEEEEYLVITKEEFPEEKQPEDESLRGSKHEDLLTKDEAKGEGEVNKLLREEEESEKKLNPMELTDQHTVRETDRSDDDRMSPKPTPLQEETSLPLPNDKIDGKDSGSTKEQKEGESLPEEKISNTLETSATTAPTLPEDEKMEVDPQVPEPDEGQNHPPEEVVQEKYIQEETKEDKQREVDDPVNPYPEPPEFTNAQRPPLFIQPVQKKSREVVKTPDEVADLPMHEEVDPQLYSTGDYAKELRKKPSETDLTREDKAPEKKDGQQGTLQQEQEPSQQHQEPLHQYQEPPQQHPEPLVDSNDENKHHSEEREQDNHVENAVQNVQKNGQILDESDREENKAEERDNSNSLIQSSIASKYLDIIDELEKSTPPPSKGSAAFTVDKEPETEDVRQLISSESANHLANMEQFISTTDYETKHEHGDKLLKDKKSIQQETLTYEADETKHLAITSIKMTPENDTQNVHGQSPRRDIQGKDFPFHSIPPEPFRAECSPFDEGRSIDHPHGSQTSTSPEALKENHSQGLTSTDLMEATSGKASPISHDQNLSSNTTSLEVNNVTPQHKTFVRDQADYEISKGGPLQDSNQVSPVTSLVVDSGKSTPLHFEPSVPKADDDDGINDMKTIEILRATPSRVGQNENDSDKATPLRLEEHEFERKSPIQDVNQTFLPHQDPEDENTVSSKTTSSGANIHVYGHSTAQKSENRTLDDFQKQINHSPSPSEKLTPVEGHEITDLKKEGKTCPSPLSSPVNLPETSPPNSRNASGQISPREIQTSASGKTSPEETIHKNILQIPHGSPLFPEEPTFPKTTTCSQEVVLSGKQTPDHLFFQSQQKSSPDPQHESVQQTPPSPETTSPRLHSRSSKYSDHENQPDTPATLDTTPNSLQTLLDPVYYPSSPLQPPTNNLPPHPSTGTNSSPLDTLDQPVKPSSPTPNIPQQPLPSQTTPHMGTTTPDKKPSAASTPTPSPSSEPSVVPLLPHPQEGSPLGAEERREGNPSTGGQVTPGEHKSTPTVPEKLSILADDRPPSDSAFMVLPIDVSSTTFSPEKDSLVVDVPPPRLDETARGEGSPLRTPVQRVRNEGGDSSGTSTPDRSHLDKSIPNGLETEHEVEKGILESERQEKESEILGVSSEEEEELKGLGMDEDEDEVEETRAATPTTSLGGNGHCMPELKEGKGNVDEGAGREGVTSRGDIRKDEKEDINLLVRSGGVVSEGENEGQDDSKSEVRRMLVTASSEDGSLETEICIQGGVKTLKEVLAEEEGLGAKDETIQEFSNLILEARKEYIAQRSRKTSLSSPAEPTDEAEENESVESEMGSDREELGSLLMQARQELAFVRSRSRERDLANQPLHKTLKKTVSVKTTETTHHEGDLFVQVIKKVTTEKQQQEDGRVKVTTTTETKTIGGKDEGTVVVVDTAFQKGQHCEEEENKEEIKEREEMEPGKSPPLKGTVVLVDTAYRVEKDNQEDEREIEKDEDMKVERSSPLKGTVLVVEERMTLPSKGTVVVVETPVRKEDDSEEDEKEVEGSRSSPSNGEEEDLEDLQPHSGSRITSTSSVVSHPEVTCRRDSGKVGDFRRSSAEMSPLKTTYITSHGHSEALMTSSFYGDLPKEEMRAEYSRAIRKGKGYESVTEIGPNGEKTERTYFYGPEDEPPFVNAYYSEEGAQRENEHIQFSRPFHGVGIPEEDIVVEETEITQKLYADKITEHEQEQEPEKFKFVKAMFPTETEANIDFAKAVQEHISARGQHLSHQTEVEGSKLEKEKEGDSKVQGKNETDKDVIEGWGKPLGLPLPQKNPNKNYEFPGQNISTTSSLSTPSDNTDSVSNWGQPMSLPSPGPPGGQNGIVEGKVPVALNKETPKKEKLLLKKGGDSKGSGTNTPNRRSQSPAKPAERRAASAGRMGKSTSNSYIYLDLTYVPHHGNSYYINVEFFKKVRARYYVFSGTEPSKEVYNALLEAKQTWEDKNLEVTIIPTYDTDILGYWVAENEDILAKHKIDLSPSASRCTINLQDHETSCSAYRLEF